MEVRYGTQENTGLSEEFRDKIFDPLFSTKIYGVGLGMSIVQQIMEQLHGRVEVESVVGQGTSMSLWLPLAEDRKQAIA